MRSAMARQREYNVAKAKSIKDLARMLMDNGLLDTLVNAEVKKPACTSYELYREKGIASILVGDGTGAHGARIFSRNKNAPQM